MELPTNAHNFDISVAKHLRYFALPGRDPAPSLHKNYESAYRFWRSLWQETLSRVANVQHLYSDDFVRQNEIASLFFHDEPVGLFLFSFFDLSLASQLDHSYFANYTPVTTENLAKLKHRHVMSMGYLSVHPEWRRGAKGVHLSEILLGLATKRFLDSQATALISYTRNDRKTHELCYRHGAQALSTKHQAHNIASDIILIERERVTPSPFFMISEMVDLLWSQRIEGREDKEISRVAKIPNDFTFQTTNYIKNEEEPCI